MTGYSTGLHVSARFVPVPTTISPEAQAFLFGSPEEQELYEETIDFMLDHMGKD